jgi:hypothetical protein
LKKDIIFLAISAIGDERNEMLLYVDRFLRLLFLVLYLADGGSNHMWDVMSRFVVSEVTVNRILTMLESNYQVNQYGTQTGALCFFWRAAVLGCVFVLRHTNDDMILFELRRSI